MDRLAELFADRPLAFAGAGVDINADTRGNATVGLEQGVVVQSRGLQAAADGAAYPWTVRRGSSITEVSVTGGGLSDGITTYAVADTTLTVHASSLNYIYLECDISFTDVDGFIDSFSVDAVAITTYTTAKTNTTTKGYVLLSTWQAGASTLRVAYWSLNAEVYGEAANPQFRTWVAS